MACRLLVDGLLSAVIDEPKKRLPFTWAPELGVGRLATARIGEFDFRALFEGRVAQEVLPNGPDPDWPIPVVARPETRLMIPHERQMEDHQAERFDA